MKEILVMPSPWWFGGQQIVPGKFTPQLVFEGTVLHMCLHTLNYSADLRAKSPRFRLLEEPVHLKHCRCELIDEWPDAPAYWPPESKPSPKPAADQGRKARKA